MRFQDWDFYSLAIFTVLCGLGGAAAGYFFDHGFIGLVIGIIVALLIIGPVRRGS